MNEEIVLRVLAEQNIDLVASLPCDKNKRLTALLPTKFPVIDLAREEDGVGICAGAYLGGRRPVMSIQRSRTRGGRSGYLCGSISRRQTARDVDSELRPWKYAERTVVTFAGV